MKILQIITLCELGGAQSVVINLANMLCQQHSVIVAAGEGDGKMFDELDSKVQVVKVPSLVRRLSPINEMKTILAFKKIYSKYQPDVIHLHSSKAGILGRLAFPPKKIVYTVHGFDSIRLAYRKFLPLEKLLQHRCAAIVGVSKYDEMNLRQEGITNKVTTIYNGIFKPKPLSDNPFIGIKGYEGKVLCIARVTPQKNLALFIKVARLLPQFAFIWIGNQNKPNVETPSNVYFMGSLNNAGSYIAFADLFFLPSNYEGLPMVIIEALANGVPVVASKVGGVTELLNGLNGKAIENDENKMTEEIKNILNASDSQRISMSHEAEQTYKNSFTVDKMVDKYLSIYTRIS